MKRREWLEGWGGGRVTGYVVSSQIRYDVDKTDRGRWKA